MAHSKQLSGLYAITDTNLSGMNIVHHVELAIQGGARLVQYRDKTDDHQRHHQEAVDILAVCHKYQVPLLINDDVELAAAIKADGVHIGRADASYTQARDLLGSQAIIGVSCYNQLTLAQQAEQAGADYVAFGSFYPSTTKPSAVQADIPWLKYAHQQLSCPIVAIGGIGAQNGQALINAGADMLAVIQGVFAAKDIRQAAQSMSDLFLSEGI